MDIAFPHSICFYNSTQNPFQNPYSQVFTYSSLRNPTGPRRQPSSFPLPFALRSPRIGPRTSRVAVRASIRRVSQAGNLGGDVFANLSSGSGQQTYTSVGKPNLPMPPPPSSSSNVGSPLFWIGVGVGFSAIFSFVASKLKQFAMQHAFNSVMDNLNAQNKQFGNAASPSGSPFPPGSPFSYPPPPKHPVLHLLLLLNRQSQ
ncbi:hypothetical protein ACOSP7_026936 [Xanthoceras sorbifolium]